MTSQDAGVAAAPPLKSLPKWQSWLTMGFGVVLIGVGILRVANYFVTLNDLPACDSQRAKDTLSGVFKEKRLNPTSYSEIKTVSSTKDLVECRATLPAGDQGILDVTYEFIRKGSDQQIQYTITARPR